MVSARGGSRGGPLRVAVTVTGTAEMMTGPDASGMMMMTRTGGAGTAVVRPGQAGFFVAAPVLRTTARTTDVKNGTRRAAAAETLGPTATLAVMGSDMGWCWDARMPGPSTSAATSVWQMDR